MFADYMVIFQLRSEDYSTTLRNHKRLYFWSMQNKLNVNKTKDSCPSIKKYIRKFWKKMFHKYPN